MNTNADLCTKLKVIDEAMEGAFPGNIQGPVIREAIAALQAEPATEPVPMTDAPVEVGWLIECNIATSAPYWLTADNTNTNDANEALRFARKIDAEGFLKVFLTAHFGDDTFGIYKRHFSPEKYSVTEHMFISIKPKGGS